MLRLRLHGTLTASHRLLLCWPHPTGATLCSLHVYKFAHLCPAPPLLQTSMKVEEGVRQLEKAEKKQKQSRMVLCIMLLLCAVVVLLLLVVFKAIFL